MSILAILEVAIGMIFAWLVMSLAGMYIQEWIVSKLNWRSNMLESHLGNLMADPNLARQLYDHPLIKGLHSGSNGRDRPAYIPSAQFSMALLDIIRNAPKEAALIQKTLYEVQYEIDKLGGSKAAQAQEELELALRITRNAIASEGGPEVTSALLNDVKKQVFKLSTDFPNLKPMIEAKFLAFAVEKKQIDKILIDLRENNNTNQVGTTLDQFKAGLAVMSITHPDLKQAIEALINEIKEISEKTENILLLVRKNIEDWFNNSMDRLSGWYKRRAQTLAFIIGITLTIIMNVDSIQLATQLWRDPSVRQAMAVQAEAMVNKNQGNFPNPDAGQLLALNMEISQLNIPVGWIGTGLPADSSGAVSIGDGSERLCTFNPQSSVELFGIHLGGQCYPIINTPKFNDLTGWLLKLVGLFITGVAAAQGAPFWFDILKNVVNVRSAGVNSDATALKSSK